MECEIFLVGGVCAGYDLGLEPSLRRKEVEGVQQTDKIMY